ncbi:hypothetical protein D3C72_2378910 [compost metagenome]
MPADAVVIGIKNMAALAHGDQALTCTGQPGEHPANRLVTLNRGARQYVDKVSGDDGSGEWGSQRQN